MTLTDRLLNSKLFYNYRSSSHNLRSVADQVLVRPDDTSEVPGYVGGMVIDGVAASEALDSSGEILDVEGADISDLKNGLGVLNWEHENGAKDVIGKIIYARKIFKKEDCEDDRQRGYWDQLELPFIYHQARLYDGAGHEAARAVAAMIRDHAANDEPILVRFSIEGSTLEKDPNDPRRLAATVARRVAATIKPCNRSCHSGLVRDPNGSIAMTKSEAGDLKPLAKTLMAGGGVGGAPDALTGLAALQPEHLGKKWVAVSMGALRDYRDYPWDRKEFGRVLKHLLPEAPQEYFDSFMDVAEKIRVPKQLLKKDEDSVEKALDDLKPGTRVDGGWDYSHLLKPQDMKDGYSLHLFIDGAKHDPLGYGVSIRHEGREVGLVYGHRYTDTVVPNSNLEEAHRGRGLARSAYEALIAHARKDGVKVMAGEAGKHSSKVHLRLQQLHGLEPGRSSGTYHHYRYQLAKNDSEAPAVSSVAPEQPMTLRGQPVSPNRHLTRPTFDEHAGILHTPKGSFPMYIPGREDDPQVFIKALSDPQVEDFHGRAVENWARMRDALRNGKTAPEVVMHATLFSQLSPQTPVPVQELQYCLGEDTILQTTEGVCKKIKNFLPGDTVFSFDSDGRVVRTQVVALHDHGDVDAYLVEFDDGYEVVCSINHKFLTRFGQLPIGEIISSGLEVCCAQEDERGWLADPLWKELRERTVGEVLDRTPAWSLVFRKVVRVCFVGIRRMYDLEVAHREHNFLLPNGIVTSNSHLVDMMRETGVDARNPEFTSLKDNWLSRDRPDRGPTHESQYFEQLQGAKSWGKGGSRPPGSFQKFPLSSGKWDSMANYHRMHQGLTDLVNRHRTDGRSAVRVLMEDKVKFGAHQRRKGQVDPFPGIPVNGLAPKTARYLFGMLGAENVVVPDTHVSRHLFGLDKDKDSATIEYVKRVLWDERNTPVLEGIDRYYAKHHPAVRFLREHPKYGSLFSEDEQALFPAFWRHWLAIPPDERARGMKSQAFNAETDHTPFWRAVDPYMSKSEESTRWQLPAETAAQHDRWVREHGEVPALMLYYRYLAPKLMEDLSRPERRREVFNRWAGGEGRGYDFRDNIRKRFDVHLTNTRRYDSAQPRKR